MTGDEATAVYDILMRECGATEFWRADFTYHQSGEFCREYRFQGALGFGGKFRRRHEGEQERWYVDCYSEDETPARRAMIDRANAALATLTTEATHG